MLFITTLITKSMIRNHHAVPVFLTVRIYKIICTRYEEIFIWSRERFTLFGNLQLHSYN